MLHARQKNELRTLEEQNNSLKQRLINTVSNSTLQKGDSTILLTSAIGVDRDLTITASGSIKDAMEGNMRESRTSEYRIEDCDERVARTIVALIQLGPEHFSAFELGEMNSLEAYQPLEMSIRLQLPWAYERIAQHILQSTTFDLNFIL